MTTELPTRDERIEALLPAARHAPAGFTGSWPCKAGTTFRIRNLIAQRIETSTHDCWTLEPAPVDVQEVEWTALTIGPNPEGGAAFYRGNVIDRFIPTGVAGERDLHHMERVAPADHEGMDSDRHPAKVDDGCVIRYLADGSMTRVDHKT